VPGVAGRHRSHDNPSKWHRRHSHAPSCRIFTSAVVHHRHTSPTPPTWRRLNAGAAPHHRQQRHSSHRTLLGRRQGHRRRCRHKPPPSLRCLDDLPRFAPVEDQVTKPLTTATACPRRRQSARASRRRSGMWEAGSSLRGAESAAQAADVAMVDGAAWRRSAATTSPPPSWRPARVPNRPLQRRWGRGGEGGSREGGGGVVAAQVARARVS
jgi:hypothetical protein